LWQFQLANYQFQQVTVGVNADQYNNARSMLPRNIRVVEISNNDSWVRDCGPTFVTNNLGGIRGIDWEFNAWGGLVDGLYFPWDKDNQVAQKILEMEKVDCYKADFVIEGGSIHTDGDGTILTTEECLLSEGRNPHLTKEEIEENLKNYVNGEKVIWLKNGIYEDETNGHVDNICCFAKPGKVILAWTDNKNDPQYDISDECYKILSKTTDAKGRKLEIHKLHLPNPILISKEESDGVDIVDGTLPRVPGMRLAASYINFYIANSAIIMPLFNDPNDQRAMDVLNRIFPDREIVGIKAKEILFAGGNIHCITQQQPSVKK
jgi:agmatine deiminase